MDRVEFSVGTGFADRATSSFPLSIGTALAFESLFAGREPPYDKERDIPDRVNVADYQECWINVATLFRNLNGAVDNSFFMAAKPQAIVDVIAEEIEVIRNLFQVEGENRCTPVFYYSDYRDLEKKANIGVTIRKANTDNQKTIEKIFNDVKKILKDKTYGIVFVDDLVRPKKHVSGLMITHHPYDLTAESHFSSLELLESHTGVLKNKRQWNTKYYPVAGFEMFHLPFHRKLLLVFGDRVQIGPMPIKFRRTVMETSIKRNWLPTTTWEKIKLDLDLDIRDPLAISVIRSL